MPVISVIVPVYKVEAYLGSCIDSILAQTFQDFELILVNDGSPDRSGEICEEYGARDSRITVLHQENKGQAAARNHAMKLAKGRWICFVDSDDLIHPQMLELLYDAVTVSGCRISMCEMLEATEVPEDFWESRKPAYKVLTIDEDTLVELYDRDAYPAWVACAKLVERGLVEGYLFREGRVFEDNEAVCHWVYGAERMAKMEHQLYFYRNNPESTTQSHFSLKKLDYLWALESILRFYSSIGCMDLAQRFFDRYVEAAVSACNALRYELDRPDLIPKIHENLRKLGRDESQSFTREQMESLLEVLHPQGIRYYWPVAGGIRTLREQGVSGLMRKVVKHLKKGDRQ